MTVALAASTAPPRRPSAPSPACMPRRRARTQTAGADTTVYLPVDITVRKLTDFFRPGFLTFVGCANIRGAYSPVLAGNRGQVVQSLAQWIAGHPELGRSPLPLQIRLHPSSSHDRPFPIDSTYVASGLASAGLGISGVERSHSADLTTIRRCPGVFRMSSPWQGRPLASRTRRRINRYVPTRLPAQLPSVTGRISRSAPTTPTAGGVRGTVRCWSPSSRIWRRSLSRSTSTRMHRVSRVRRGRRSGCRARRWELSPLRYWTGSSSRTVPGSRSRKPRRSPPA